MQDLMKVKKDVTAVNAKAVAQKDLYGFFARLRRCVPTLRTCPGFSIDTGCFIAARFDAFLTFSRIWFVTKKPARPKPCG